jgi:hypothetical protein
MRRGSEPLGTVCGNNKMYWWKEPQGLVQRSQRVRERVYLLVGLIGLRQDYTRDK